MPGLTPNQTAELETINKAIIDVLNAGAPGAFSQTIEDEARSLEAVVTARRHAAWDVIRAVADNPAHGLYPNLKTLFPVAHDADLPAHLGEAGTPRIVPFEGASEDDGTSAEPAEIDSVRRSHDFFSFGVAHDEPDDNGERSPNSCLFSIERGRLKFTGFAARVPLILAPESAGKDWIDERTPLTLAGTVVKLSIQYLVKLDDNLSRIAPFYTQLGLADLQMIRRGQEKTGAAPRVAQIPMDAAKQ